ncbi:hypothetical protein TKK_0001977 [Trichogramma kaykai]|uniref:Transmembrane protein 223 n=1 Tax=Trichogramma kaykai TaxID=54128 RepID=A0ABD2X978_9HYME
MFSAVLAASRLHAATGTVVGGSVYSKIAQQCLSQRGSYSQIEKPMQKVRKFGDWRSFFNSNLLFRSENINVNAVEKNHNQSVSSKRWNIIQFFRSYSNVPLANPLKVNTKVLNNVMLYRFEKPFMFKAAAAFGILTCIGCLTMADTIYLVLCKDLFNPEKDLWTRLKAHVLPLAGISIGVICGPLILITVWFITVRSVKYLILHKGGKSITLVAYHPIKMEKKYARKLEEVSSVAARSDKKGYVPLKLKGVRFHFILDKQGHFVNPELFDCTAGIKRFE